MTEGAEVGGRERPEGLIGALVVVVVLAAVLGTAIAVAGLRIQGADVRALYEETFGGEPGEVLPLGLVFVDGTAMAGEQRWIVLRRPIEEGAPDPHPELPVKVAVGRFGNALPARRLFAPTRENLPRDLTDELEKWEEEPYRFQAVTRRGLLAFGAQETDYVVQRHFEADGTFFDLVRVDLTVGNTGGVLEAHWPVGHDGADPTVLVPLLESVRLPEPDPDAAPVLPAPGDSSSVGS